MAAQLAVGVWKRTWTFAAWVSVACLLEPLGYIGRPTGHSNPWPIAVFEIRICYLVLASTVLVAGVCLMLKHVVNFVDLEYSKIKPNRYPWIFVCCDICTIVTQAVGGGIAESSGSGSHAYQSIVNSG